MLFRKNAVTKSTGEKDDNFNDEKDDIETILEIVENIEVATKSTKIDTKDLLNIIKDALNVLPTISELKKEINELKEELKQEKQFNRELIIRLIEKPSAAQSYLASKAAVAANSSVSSATAGPKGKLP